MARIPPKTVSKDDKSARHSSDLKRVVFGQDKAIEALSAAIKLARAGLREPGQADRLYLFSGPTGVGKTEVARSSPTFWASSCCASTCRNTWSATRSRA
jgi:ATP-dependent Clp protease ATP-binding subunit ClpA